MKYFVKLMGSRLYLSPLCSDDVSIFVRWFNDKTVSENIGIDTEVLTVKKAKEWLRDNQNDYNFGIISKEGDELIGFCGFSCVDLIHENAELKIFIGDKKNRGQGYGKEAIKLLLDYGFNNLNLNNIMLKVFSFNKKAIKLYESLGFKKFGIRHKTYCFKSQFYDEIYMEVLKDEYNEIETFIYV